MGPTWVLSAPDGPHVGPMNLAVRGCLKGIPLCWQYRTNRFQPSSGTLWIYTGQLLPPTIDACCCFNIKTSFQCMHICWFDFDALAQGNAYKATKGLINYHGLSGDQTHGLQTEETPQLPVVQHVCFMPQKLCKKHNPKATCSTGQLTTRLEVTGVNFNTCVC